jgi:hypothetical protein
MDIHIPLIYFVVILPHTSRCTGNLASERTIFSDETEKNVAGSGIPYVHVLPKNFPVKTGERDHKSPKSGKMASSRFKQGIPQYQ